jgi:putative ABC transport system permease protein
MTPPKIARLLLRASLPRDDRHDVLANLEQLYQERRRRGGTRHANRWYWRQALMFPVRLRWPRRNSNGATRRAGFDLPSWFADFRIAARGLWRAPTYTVVAALTIALGIGATTSIFSMVNGVLLKPLPYPDAQEIVVVWRTGGRATRGSLSYPDFDDWRRDNSTFAGLGGHAENQGVFQWDEGATQLTGERVSVDVLPLLGVRPLLGRWFTEDEDRLEGPRAIVLSHRLWQRRFGGDSAVVGGTIRMDDRLYQIVGIMPPEFLFPVASRDYWIPLREDELLKDAGFNRQATRYLNFITVVARLRPGVAPAAAAADLAAIGQRVDGRNDFGAGLEGLQEYAVGDVRFMLLVFLGAVALVLAIACANVANLALSRSTGRRRELALRSALGAGRFRLARHILAENLLVALVGGVVGVAIAAGGVDLFLRMAADTIPRSRDVSLDGLVLGFTTAITVLSGMAFGLFPALQSRSVPLDAAMRAETRGTTAGRQQRRLRHGLVVAQVGLAVMLLIGAGLLLNSFVRLTSVDTGFDARNVLTASVSLPVERYDSDDVVLQFFDDLVTRIGALPGVTRVATSYSLPFAGSNFQQSFFVEGTEPGLPDQAPWAGTVIVGEGFFRASGVPILRGRAFDAGDRVGAPRVAIVNETMARTYWPGEDALGRRFRTGSGLSGAAASLDPRFLTRDWLTVVGVAADVRRRGLESDPIAEFYRPHAQMAWPSMSLLVRTEGSPEQLIGALQRQVWALDRRLAVTDVSTARELLARSVATPRLRMTLLSAFAAVAALLAMVGVYGVMALAVAQRTQEIGVRMALGAGRSRVVGDVLKRGLGLTGMGIVLGVAVSVAATRVLATMLFGVSAHDPVTFAAVTVFLALVAALACYIPARRASRVDPLEAIRAE